MSIGWPLKTAHIAFLTANGLWSWDVLATPFKGYFGPAHPKTPSGVVLFGSHGLLEVHFYENFVHELYHTDVIPGSPSRPISKNNPLQLLMK